MQLRQIMIALLLPAMGACAQFPSVDASVSDRARQADFPTLLPMDQLTQYNTPPQIDDALVGSLEARVANLRARAARLRGQVISQQTRQYLQDGAARL
ncbi:hypothetical protein [Cochlodiniinecator piscidefendens]|uniref:hypothetical protein n=1 Tax=Cochlodiniinecator piscidefendens TaxID=2715756 RepID=UPI00140AE3FF|nr:hypothetical protein [Cochlodiniinecator piscidefendens]